jgi:hypothetical protein
MFSSRLRLSSTVRLISLPRRRGQLIGKKEKKITKNNNK